MKKTRRKLSKKRKCKTRRNKKGGLLNTMSLGLNGFNVGQTTGQKRYNWKTGNFDDITYYNVGPFKFYKKPDQN